MKKPNNVYEVKGAKMTFKVMERPQKREVQSLLTHSLIGNKPDNYEKGNVFILCGPEPVKAAEQYFGHGLADYYTLAEQDRYTFRKAFKYIDALEKAADADCWIHNNDIKALVRVSDCVAGLDLDFCSTLNRQLILEIREMLQSVIQHNLLPCFWLRFTFSMRGSRAYTLRKRILAILSVVLNNTPYVLEGEKAMSYHDTSAMFTWQAYVVRNGTPSGSAKLPKPSTGMRIIREKTVKKLSPAKLEILRGYVETMDPKESSEAVARKFGVTRQTVAAMKAWRTMRGK